MATIVCDSKRFAFVHIPKCAGMSVTTQLKELVDWDTRFVGQPLYDHPVLGPQMRAHLPLEILRDFYPETLEKYRSYDTYAVTRDPASRFLSSVAQHLREFYDTDLYDLDDTALTAVLNKIIQQMRETPVKTPVEFIHFTRQSDYVDLDGERVVKNLYTTQTLPRLCDDMKQRYGLTLNLGDLNAVNKTTAYRTPGLKQLLRRGGKVARKILPRTVYKATRSRAKGLATVASSQRRPAAFDTPRVQDFIAEFYAKDEMLWSTTRTGQTQKNSASPNPDQLEDTNAH